MTRQRLNLFLSHDQFENLSNALEDHRDGFTEMANGATSGFALDSAYWKGRTEQVHELLVSIRSGNSIEAAGRSAVHDNK